MKEKSPWNKPLEMWLESLQIFVPQDLKLSPTDIFYPHAEILIAVSKVLNGVEYLETWEKGWMSNALSVAFIQGEEQAVLKLVGGTWDDGQPRQAQLSIGITSSILGNDYCFLPVSKRESELFRILLIQAAVFLLENIEYRLKERQSITALPPVISMAVA